MGFITFSWILDAIIFIPTFFIIALYFYMTRNFNYWKKRNVVEITPVPFVGNWGKYLTYQKSPGALLKYFYDKGKGLPYVGIYLLDKPGLVIRDPEILKRILIKDFNYFADKLMRPSEHDVMSNNSIFFIDNPDWKYVRQKLTSLFTTGKMKYMFDVVREVGNDLDNHLDSLQLEGEGKVVNVKDIAGKFTTDLIGLGTFGLRLNSLKNPEAEFRKFGEQMFPVFNIKRALELATIWLAPHYSTLFGFRFFGEGTCEFFRKAFREIFKERLQSGVKHNDFVDLMIQLREQEKIDPNAHPFKFEGDNAICQALAIFVAGYETASVLMGFCLFELARHPEMQTRLRNEIREAMDKNNGEITYDMVTEMAFLDMIVHETLRMYPTLPMIDRKATQDYKIEETGLVIEKGTPIFIPSLGFHYDPQYYTNPRVFNPERFSSENKSSLNPNVYLAFGIGGRNCIGTRQGLLQTKLGLILIISKYEVSIVKNTALEFEKLSILSSSRGGLFLNIRKLDLKGK